MKKLNTSTSASTSRCNETRIVSTINHIGDGPVSERTGHGIPHFLKSRSQYEAEEYLRDHPVDLPASNQADVDEEGPEEQVVDGNSLPDTPVPEEVVTNVTNTLLMDLDKVSSPHYDSITSTHKSPAVNEN